MCRKGSTRNPWRNGKAFFRGFCGEYDITVRAGEKEVRSAFSLSKRGTNTLTVRI